MKSTIATVRLRKRGQVVIPEPNRNELNLKEGDLLRLVITKGIEQTDSEYYTEKEVSNMYIISDNFREYLYGWDDAFVPGKGYLKKYVDMYLTHTH